MKTFKHLISELSLTTLTRYRNAASKQNKKLFSRLTNFDHPVPSGYMKPLLLKMKNRSSGIQRATDKINHKMNVSKLKKPLEK
jgi:hypothetical protein